MFRFFSSSPKPTARPIPELLAEFENELVAGKGNTPRTAAGVRTKAAHMLHGLTLPQITQAIILERLAALQTGSAGRRGWNRAPGLSIGSRNKYMLAVTAFLKWCVAAGHLEKMPLRELSCLREELDKRHPRRCITTDELGRLIEAAQAGIPIQSISGPDRAVIYLLAAYTGLRKAEIGALTRHSFALDDIPPRVSLAAIFTKSRRQAAIPLAEGVADALRPWLATRDAVGSLWTTNLATAQITKGMRLDCEAAGIAYCDAEGRYCDLHSLRYWFATNLTASGAAVQTTQRLMRHAHPETTIRIYTQLPKAADLAAVNKLPPPPPLRIARVIS